MAFAQVNATRIAKRVVNRSFRLRDRYRQELGKLDPAEQWIVVQEVSKQIEQFTEKVAFAAQIQKEIIDAWTDEDYAAMDTTREDVREVVKYVEVITPLSIYSEKSERRKARARERLENAWGRRWEAKLGELMPPWPAEGFMRELAVFAESNPKLNDAIVTMKENIAERLAAPRTKKDPNLMSRDISEKVMVQKRRVRRRRRPVGNQPQQQNEEAESEGSGGEDENQGGEDEGGEEEQEDEEDGEEEEGEEEQGEEEEEGEEGQGGEDQGGENLAAKEQAKAGTKKRKGNDKPSGPHKRRKFALTIQVPNLEIDEGIEKLRTNAGDNEEDIEDVTRVREALRGLFGDQDDVPNEVLERRMEKLMRAMMMEVVETEE